LPKTLQPIPEEIQRKHLDLAAKYSKRTDLKATEEVLQ